MLKIKALIFVTTLYFCAVNYGLGLKCWKCRSLEDPKCADPFDNTSIPFFDCSQEPEDPHLPGVKANLCRKTRQKVDGHWRYIRDCARLGEPGIGGDERYCIQRSGTFNIHVETCTCNTKDGCNTGTSFGPYLPLLFVGTMYVLGGLRIHR